MEEQKANAEIDSIKKETARIIAEAAKLEADNRKLSAELSRLNVEACLQYAEQSKRLHKKPWKPLVVGAGVAMVLIWLNVFVIKLLQRM